MSPAQPVTSASLRDWPLPTPDAQGDKDTRGSVVVVGGSRHMPGAVLLTAEACLRSGAGKAQVFTDEELCAAIAPQLPEAWFGGGGPDCVVPDFLPRADALVIGPGLASVDHAERAVAWLGDGILGLPMILDAFALPLARRLAGRGATRMVLTPHAGEMAAITGLSKGTVQAQGLETARGLAAELAAVVMLKGPTTWIAAPDGRAWLSTTGGIGLGTGGSGDVLAGITAGLIAQGADGSQAAVWAAHTHGLCGDHLARNHGRVGFLAREILPVIPLMLELPR